MTICLRADPFEDKYGIGVIKVNCIPIEGLKGEYTVDLYDAIGDHTDPVMTYMLRYGSTEFWSKAKELNHMEVDFNGEIVMLCIGRQNEWYKVRIKNDQEFWTRNVTLSYSGFRGTEVSENRYEFNSWERFIAQVNWVSRMDRVKNPIHSRPDERSKTIEFDAPECMTATSSKGYWLQVTPQNGEGCFDDNAELDTHYQRQYFKSGWIQWRDENDFLISVTRPL